jgi:tetratricopeptide (TPR) repeat protein/TolB-like protein
LKQLRIAVLLSGLLYASLLGSAQPQNPATGAQTVVVMPFDNASSAPGLEWISEAIPEILGQRLASPTLYVVERNDRVRAYDRAGIPLTVHPARATLYRIAEQMDVDYVVLGQYTYDGRTFSARADLVDMRGEKLLGPSTESGLLVELVNIQTGLAWNLLHRLRPDFTSSREAYISTFPPLRLDALENYVRGTIATTPRDKIGQFREAVRINPSYNEAWLQLGRTYLAERQYDQAISAFSRIPQTIPLAREANFYMGLAAYYAGDFAKAESAFNFVALTLPLPEVYNNLAVVSGRRRRKNEVELFQKAVQDDPSDPDYHFNLGLAFYHEGDTSSAVRQLRETLALRPNDVEAKSLYERISGDSAAKTPTPAGTLTPAAIKAPLQRMKRSYDENSFRVLALKIQAVAEQGLAKADPPTHARFHVTRGNELLSQGFTSEAEKEFREAVSLDPANAQAHTGLARILESSNDVTAARSEAEAALRLKPLADALLVLARLDLRENKIEAAAQNVNKALQLEPSNPAAQALKTAVAAKLAEKAQPLPNR